MHPTEGVDMTVTLKRLYSSLPKLALGAGIGLTAAGSGWGVKSPGFKDANTNASFSDFFPYQSTYWVYDGVGSYQNLGSADNPASNQNNYFDRGDNTGAPAVTVFDGGYVELYGDDGDEYTNTIIGGLRVYGDDGNGQSSYVAMGNGVQPSRFSIPSVTGGAGHIHNHIDSITVGTVDDQEGVYIDDNPLPFVGSTVDMSNSGSGSVTNTDKDGGTTGIDITIQGNGEIKMANYGAFIFGGIGRTGGTVTNYVHTVNVNPTDTAIGAAGILDMSQYASGGAVDNHITGDFTIGINGMAKLYQEGSGRIHNTVDGDTNVYGILDMSGTNQNTFNGSMTIHSKGFANFNYCDSNYFDKLVEVKGRADFISSSNTFNDDLNIDGGAAFMYNGDGWSRRNTLGNVNVTNGGEWQLGGSGSKTNAGDVTVDDGTLTFGHANGSWGDTTFSNLTAGGGGLNIQLFSYDDGNPYTLETLPTGKTCLTKITNDFNNPENVTVVNVRIPFGEIAGVVYDDGKGSDPKGIYVDTGLAETVGEGTTDGTLGDFMGNSSNIARQAASEMKTFAASSPSPQAMARMRMSLKDAMRKNPNNPWENLVAAMSESGHEPQVLKFKGDYRVWTMPYNIYTRNTGSAGAGTGFTEKNYGMLLGASHFVKSMQVNVSGVFGFGLINQQMAARSGSKTKGKQFTLGLMTNKKIFTDYEWISSAYYINTLRDQSRQGNPSATQSYIAKSSYRTSLLSWQNELGRVFKLQDNWSVRPLVGLQMAATRRPAFKETLTQQVGNVPDTTFAQRYKAKTSITGEAYTGMGVRKKWDDDRYEGKITCSYEIGQKSGNGRARTDVAAGNQSLSVSSNTPGRFTQYINVYGSLLDKQSNWKFMPSATVTLQRGQRSLTTSLRMEYRF